MSRGNSHQSLYRGPAKGIPTQSMRARVADKLSAYSEPGIYVLGLLVVLADVFYWRP